MRPAHQLLPFKTKPFNALASYHKLIIENIDKCFYQYQRDRLGTNRPTA